MEILGSVASIAQLLRYALSLVSTISGIYRDIQDGPALQDQQIRQLERLLSIVLTLHENSAFSTSCLKENLEAITVRVQDLKVILERLVARQRERPIKKYLKALIRENREEHRILEVFIDLEKDKSTLLLSIAGIHTELSAKIYKDLTERFLCTQTSQIKMPLKQKNASAKDKAAKEISASSSLNDSSIAKIPGSQDTDVEGRDPRGKEGLPDANQERALISQQRLSHSEGLKNALTEVTEGPSTAFPQEGPNLNGPSQQTPGHVYESITFLGSADIHVGDVGSKRGDERSHGHRYQRVQAKEGRATLGNAYDDGFVEKFYREKK